MFDKAAGVMVGLCHMRGEYGVALLCFSAVTGPEHTHDAANAQEVCLFMLSVDSSNSILAAVEYLT